MSERFDVVIVGAGPAGMGAGVTAAKRGLSHVLLERSNLANTIYRYQKGKFVMAEPDRLPLHEQLPLRFTEGVREKILQEWDDDCKGAGVNLRTGPEWEVTKIEGEKGSFTVTVKSGAQMLCDNVVLSIGCQGNLRTFGVEGDNLPHVTYQLDDPGAFEDKSIAVVGAGDAGIENALALSENGNDVAIVNRRDEFDRAKARNRSLIEGAIKSGDIQYFPNTSVDHFEERKVIFNTENGEVAFDADLVIGRLGAIPPRKFLEDLGVTFPSKDIAAVPQVSDHYESATPGVFLVGAIIGYPLIKNCINQGHEVIEYLLGNDVTPADEPILREKFGHMGVSPSELVERVRTTVPLFSKLTPIQLREFLVDSDIGTLPAGETIFALNDYSTEFYAVLDGRVEITLPASDEDRDIDLKEKEKESKKVVVEKGGFFGEGSLISGRRRTGTAVTAAETTLIEIPRGSMNKLIASFEDVKRVLDSAFLAAKLADLFNDLDAGARQQLAENAEPLSFKPGEKLFEQGDEPDGLHLIRKGAVSISRRFADRDVVVNYVQAGNYLGEIGLVGAAAKRSATATAAVATDTVRLPTSVMSEYLERHPSLRRQFEEDEQRLRKHDVQVADPRIGTDLMSLMLAAGAGEATDLLVIDETLCVRCDNCEKACAGTHGGVSRLDREGGPYFGNIHVPTACQHCEHPKCMNDCPPDALRRHSNGEVYVMDNCIGCGNCVSNCPYKVIQLAKVKEIGRRNVLFRLLFGDGESSKNGADEAAAEPDDPKKDPKLAVKCDLCRKLPEPRAGGTRASCVAACPTGAILRVKPKEFLDSIRGLGS